MVDAGLQAKVYAGAVTAAHEVGDFELCAALVNLADEAGILGAVERLLEASGVLA